jgi:hypothetical protein
VVEEEFDETIHEYHHQIQKQQQQQQQQPWSMSEKRLFGWNCRVRKLKLSLR